MNDMEKRPPKIRGARLTSEDWLTIEFEDTDGVATNFNMWDHRIGSWGSVVLKGLDLKCVHELYNCLGDIIELEESGEYTSNDAKHDELHRRIKAREQAKQEVKEVNHV